MRSRSELLNLFNNANYFIRKQNCQGCYHNHGMQREHLICMTNIDKEIYTLKTLIFLLDENKIDLEEFEYLNFIHQSPAAETDYEEGEEEDLTL